MDAAVTAPPARDHRIAALARPSPKGGRAILVILRAVAGPTPVTTSPLSRAEGPGGDGSCDFAQDDHLRG